jgi:hypothetical protein
VPATGTAFTNRAASVSATGTATTVAAAAKTRKKRKTKPTTLKLTAPVVVSKEGTYYRVLNVSFNERHRPDVLKIGATSTRAELDARSFKNKVIFDSLVSTYLATDTDPVDLGVMSFPDDPFFDSLGIDDKCPGNYDPLTSLYFAEVMDYLNFHYATSHRNWKKSGTHNDFEMFVGQQPYLYYYHLWLVEIPILKNLAVALLPKNVGTESQTSESGNNTSTCTDEGGGKQKKSGMVAAFSLIGTASVDKIALLKQRIVQKEAQVGFAWERHGLAKSRELSSAVQEYGLLLEAAEEKLQLTTAFAPTDPRAITAKKMVDLWQSKLNMAIQSLSEHKF